MFPICLSLFQSQLYCHGPVQLTVLYDHAGMKTQRTCAYYLYEDSSTWPKHSICKWQLSGHGWLQHMERCLWEIDRDGRQHPIDRLDKKEKSVRTSNVQKPRIRNPETLAWRPVADSTLVPFANCFQISHADVFVFLFFNFSVWFCVTA